MRMCDESPYKKFKLDIALMAEINATNHDH